MLEARPIPPAAGGFVRRIVKRVAAPALSLAAVFLVGGCGIFDRLEPPPPGPCPRVLVLGDAAELTRFRAGAENRPEGILFELRLVRVTDKCDYDGTKSVSSEIEFELVGQIGPGATSRNFEIEYFVAVPGLYPMPAAKRLLPLRIKFSDKNTRVVIKEKAEVELPLAANESGANYPIYIGFQMTKAEVEFSRSRRR